MRIRASRPWRSNRAGRDTFQVLKFGGSSFLELADYRRVAASIIRRLDRNPGTRVVVVVSGMSGTTGNLLGAALEIDPTLQPAVQDQVLSTAEMVSATFLRAALNAEGCPSLDLWAHQVGLRSDDVSTRAQVKVLDPRPLRAALRDHRVVVVAGGQAVDANGRITMLGRNSSDLTAVLMAVALGAGACEIFSDVPGVYTADPHVVPAARLLPRLSYGQCEAMSASGAKVLHGGSVRTAASYGVEILCRAVEDVAGDAVDRGAVNGRADQPGGTVSGRAVNSGAIDRVGDRPGGTAGTVVGTGVGTTAVVGDRRAQVYRVARGVPEMAMDSLWASGLTVVRAALPGRNPVDGGADRAGGDIVAVTGSHTGVAAALRRAGLDAEPLETLGLVSTVEPDGRARRLAVPVDEVDAMSRSLHEDIYGRPADRPADQASSLREKRRSSHSGLLARTTASAGASVR